jgi:hypothetical protein
MSETVIARGKLIPTHLNLWDFLVIQGQCLLEDDYGDVIEIFDDKFGETHAVVDGMVYERQGTYKPFYENIFQATHATDGSIEYLLVYHNGGCGFQEALEYALKKSN